MPNELGKRYTCEECGAIYLVVRAGGGGVGCHDHPTVQQAAKRLPSSD
jgi:hypothetical protein